MTKDNLRYLPGCEPKEENLGEVIELTLERMAIGALIEVARAGISFTAGVTHGVCDEKGYVLPELLEWGLSYGPLTTIGLMEAYELDKKYNSSDSTKLRLGYGAWAFADAAFFSGAATLAGYGVGRTIGLVLNS